MAWWTVAVCGLAATAGGAKEGLLDLLGSDAAVVRHTLGGCREVADEPGALDCAVEDLPPATRANLRMDRRGRLQSIAPCYPAQPTLEAATAAVRPLLLRVERRWGAPQVKSVGGGREWILSRREVVALVRLTAAAGSWQTQVLVTDPTLHGPAPRR